jgi:hypothetical protein
MTDTVHAGHVDLIDFIAEQLQGGKADNSHIDYKRKQVTSLFTRYYSSFVTDNRDVLYFLNDLNKENESTETNTFDEFTKYILSMDYNQEDDPSIEIEQYSKMLLSISETASVLYDIIYDTNNFAEVYKMIKHVELSNTTPQTSSTTLKILPNNETSYHIVNHPDGNGNILKIYNANFTQLDFQKIYEHVYNNAVEINDEVILKNYIHFLLSFKEYNLKIQVYAIHYLLITVQKCKEYFIERKNLIENTDEETTCQIYLKIIDILNSFIAIKSHSDSLLKNSGSGSSIDVICENLCPIRFDVSDTSDINIDKNTFLHSEYNVYIENKMYEISSADYEINEENRQFKKVKSITLKASSDSAKNCPVNLQKNKLTINLKQEIEIEMKHKNMIDLKSEFVTLGNELKGMNLSIEQSKKKINKLVKSNATQKGIISSIDFRMKTYYVIIAIIILAYLYLILMNSSRELKLNVGSIAILLAVIMNIANYIYNFDYIESFENGTEDQDESGSIISRICNLTFSKDTYKKDDFMRISDIIYLNTMYDVVTTFSLYLSSIDTNEFYRDMTGSLLNEKKSFQEYDAVYKYKLDDGKKSIDIMRHEMIDKTGFINFISASLFMVSGMYLLYTYVDNNKHLGYYLAIVTVLIIFNLYIFYYTILHPVQTRAKNKYWYTPSEQAQRNMS